jgi:hypothetical protein
MFINDKESINKMNKKLITSSNSYMNKNYDILLDVPVRQCLRGCQYRESAPG